MFLNGAFNLPFAAALRRIVLSRPSVNNKKQKNLWWLRLSWKWETAFLKTLHAFLSAEECVQGLNKHVTLADL